MAVNGAVLPLTRSEYAICEYLALYAGQTFSKEQIYEAVFGVDGNGGRYRHHPAHQKHPRKAAGCRNCGSGTAAQDRMGSGIPMEKRKLISLRGVLLRYLAVCVVSCILAAVLWFLGLLLLIGNGMFLPADAAANATVKAVQRVSEMTAERFDDAGFDSLCRYALFDGNELLRTNMDDSICKKRCMYERAHAGGKRSLLYAVLHACGTERRHALSVPIRLFRALCRPRSARKTAGCAELSRLLGFLLLMGSSQDAPTGRLKFLAVETGRLTEASRKVAGEEGAGRGGFYRCESPGV